MEEIERPEKRRKLESEKEDGNQAPRCPRVVLNKINVDNALLERFRKIKKLARQKLGPKLEIKTSTDKSTEAGEKEGKALDLLKATEGSTNTNDGKSISVDSTSNETSCTERREGINLFTSSKCSDETVEVLDSSEKWMHRNESQKTAKRKRDENCNESTSVDKVAKFLEGTSVSIVDGKQLQPLSDTTEIVLSTSEEVNKKKSSSHQYDEGLEASGTCENQQNNVVKVTKVAQDYAKSGAQTEKNNNVDLETAEKNGENADVKNTFESEDYSEEALVYQLLREVIEKQTSVFANNLVLENAKLEKRVGHLERENAMLQRTSKRLHLALQAVLKNREKAKLPKCSRGVQVNMDLQHRPSFRQKPPVDNDTPEEKSQGKSVEKKDNVSSLSPITESSLVNAPRANKIPTKGGDQSGGESKTREVTMTTIGTQTQEQTTPKYFTEGMGHFKLQSCNRHRGLPAVVDSGEKSHYKMTPYGLELKTKSHAGNKNQEEESRTQVTEAGDTQTKDSPNFPTNGTSVHEKRTTDQNFKSSDNEKRASPLSDKGSRKEHAAIANADVAICLSAKQKSTSSDSSNESLRSLLKTSKRSQNVSLATKEYEKEVNYHEPHSPVIPKNSINPTIQTVNLPRNQSPKTMVEPRDQSLKLPRDQLQRGQLPRDQLPKTMVEPRDQSPKLPRDQLQRGQLPRDQFPKTRVEPDLIIVSSNEPSQPSRKEMPRLRPNNESSIRAVQNEVKSRTKEIEMLERKRREREIIEKREREIYERKQRERQEQKESELLARQEKEMIDRQRPVYYSTSVRPKERTEMLVERTVGDNTTSKLTPATLNNHNPNPQEMRQTTAVHLSQIQSQQAIQYTNAVIRAREQTSQGSPPVSTRLAQGASRTSRYVASEMRVVGQTEGRENGSDPRGSIPPQLIPSQPQRVQEQFRSSRSIQLENSDAKRQQGHAISGISEVHNGVNVQRTAAQSMRSQQPPPLPHLTPQQHLQQQQLQQQQQQQQLLIARQQQLQRMVPPAYQQPTAGNPKGFNQHHPQASQQNMARQQAPPPYQSPHHLQQVPRPAVDPGRSRANMPLSPEFGRTFITRAPYKDAPPHLIPGNVQQTRQGPVVVYQPGALEGGVRPAAPASQAHFERYQDQMRQGQNPPVSQMGQLPQRVTNNVVEQVPPGIQSQRAPSYEMQRADDRRQRVVPERTQQTNSTASSQRSPPKPSASIAIVENGIVLSWNVSSDQDTSDIDSYELFACQDDSNSNCPPVLWKKIGVVKALPLPMACTLTQFSNGSRYQFAVRAVDSAERAGPFSDPCVILLKKP